MAFEDWFYEMEGFALRAERFYSEIDPDCRIDSERLVAWLKAAYKEGYDQSRYDTMKLYWDDGK